MPTPKPVHHENRREKKQGNYTSEALSARLNRHRQRESHRRCCRPAQHALEGRNRMELERSVTQSKNDEHRHEREAHNRRDRARHAAKFRPDKNGQVHLIGAGRCGTWLSR